MPKVFTSKTQKTGELGERIAVKYLQGKGYRIIERNYTKKWGEIDVIAEKSGIVYFIEVKSKTISDFDRRGNDRYKPEDQMHLWKIERLRRTVQTYLLERRIDGEWQFGLITVYLDPEKKQAKVQFLENIII